MNVFTAGSRHQPWVWQVTGLCFVLGLLLAGSVRTVNNVRKSGGASRLGFSPVQQDPRLSKKIEEQDKEIAELRAQKTALENTLAKGTGEASLLNKELQDTKLVAGLTNVKGPGIVLTLKDSKKGPPSNRSFEIDNYIIHDVTLQRALNELNASGAEAIAINGQRITGRTAIRCVGPTAQINGVPLASPYEIHAIGDPNTLNGGLTIPEGFAEFIQSYDPEMIRIEKRSEIYVPGYTGTTDFKHAKPAPAEETKAAEEKRRAQEPAAAPKQGGRP
jgi:uncharacterized protein YlxW (UPF0749 family)